MSCTLSGTLRLILVTCCLLLIPVKDASSEFNSSQQQHHHYTKQSNPVIRQVDVPSGGSSHGFGGRLASGGKYRSSFYRPKAVKNTTPSPGGANPVWVVWGRQGTPFEDNNNNNNNNGYQPSDFQQYTVAGGEEGGAGTFPNNNQNNNLNNYFPSNNNYFPSNNNYFPSNNFLGGNNDLLENPYQDELASYPSGLSWTRADSDGSDEFNENDIDELTANQLQGATKTRRTGLEASIGGLLSLKGLKLSALGFFYLFRGVVILAWKFLPWIFLVVVAFMFIPVPIITIPAAAGRSGGEMLNINMTQVTSAVTDLVHQVEGKEQCVERMACELRRRSRETWFQPPLKLLIYNYQSKLPSAVQRMAKAYLQRKRCKLYRCMLYNETLK